MSGFQFPEGFLWGASTSAHQVEGQNLHSDWWAWEQAGRVKEPSGLACDHYRRYADDIDLAASLGHTAHRFSIEWARIEPSEGQWDDAALRHYVDVVRHLRRRRLEPLVTLHHFTNPQWFLARGGRPNPKSVEWFARYAQRIAQALDGSARYWLTINEPLVYVRMHYIQGLGPPGARDLGQALQVIQHMIHGHAAAYHALHAARPIGGAMPRVGFAHYIPEFWPCRRWSLRDRWIAQITDRIFTVAFLQGVTEGRVDVPGMAAWRLPDARSTMDYLGFNYYNRQFIRWAPDAGGAWPGQSCDVGHHREVTERNALGWDVNPDAFGRLLVRLGGFGVPIFVTENGTYMEEDARRERFIVRHIQAMARAMQRGAPVIGYCYWSLLDNFEWADGYGPRFGLVNVDYATQQRTVRGSAKRYAEICTSNRVDMSPER